VFLEKPALRRMNRFGFLKKFFPEFRVGNRDDRLTPVFRGFSIGKGG